MANVAQRDRQMQQQGAMSAFAPNVNPFLGILPPELWKNQKDFFVYATDFNTIATAATNTNNIGIQSDSHFLIVAGVVAVQATAGATATGSLPATIDILDAGSGRKFNNVPVHIQNLFGTGQNPAYWPYPKLIMAGSTLQTTLANLDATNAYVVRLAYWGLKIFGY